MDPFDGSIGLNVPYEWWPSPAMLEEIPGGGGLPAGSSFRRRRRPSSPILGAASVTPGPSAARSATTGLRRRPRPGDLLAGEPARRSGASTARSPTRPSAAPQQVVYHAAMVARRPRSARIRLLLRVAIARRRSRRPPNGSGVTLALENLAPVFPGPETVSANPLAVRALARRIGSTGRRALPRHRPRQRRRRLPPHLAPRAWSQPVLDMVASSTSTTTSERAGGHATSAPSSTRSASTSTSPPGRGDPWFEVGALRRCEPRAPLLLEVHPPRRQRVADLARSMQPQLTRARDDSPFVGLRVA